MRHLGVPILFALSAFSGSHAAHALDAKDVQYNAMAATITGFPLVEGYRSVYEQHIDRNSTVFKTPIGKIYHQPLAANPRDIGLPSASADVLNGSAFVDLRAQPVVLTMPAIEENRYYSVQVNDLYTHYVDYIGSRNDGNAGGNFLIAGPGWTGTPPASIKRTISVDTEFVALFWRTQAFGPSDVERVRAVQMKYKLQPLNEFLGKRAPAAARAVQWPRIDRSAMSDPKQFFAYVDFLMQFCHMRPAESKRFQPSADIGMDGKPPYGIRDLPVAMRDAVVAGYQDGLRYIDKAIAQAPSPITLYGLRQSIRDGDYAKRAAAARIGVYGISPQEIVEMSWSEDAAGEAPNSGKHKYVLRFVEDGFAPINHSWSLAAYDENKRLMADNPLKRYVFSSFMLPNMRRDPDGGLTLYIQKDSPGVKDESNWLPAPDGPMFLLLRLFLPKPFAQRGDWKLPPLERSD